MANSLCIVLLSLRGNKVEQRYCIEHFAFFMQKEPYRLCSGKAVAAGTLLSIEPSQSGWWLVNRTDDIRCSINGKTVSPQHRMLLSDGDIVEWGLSSWKVSPVEPAQKTNVVPQMVQPRNAEAFIPETLSLDWFDPRARFDDDDGHVFDFILPQSDELPHASSLQEADSNETSADTDLLNQLGVEYQRAIRSPDLSAGQHDLQNIQRIEETPDALSDLVAKANPLATLQDLVIGPLSIDDVFDGLDNLAESALFQQDETPEILHLFAPRQQTRGARNSQPPALTRKEHHAIGVNSHYRMTQYQPEKESADD